MVNIFIWYGFCVVGGGIMVLIVVGIGVSGCGFIGNNVIDILMIYLWKFVDETFILGFQCVELFDCYLYVVKHWGVLDGNGVVVVCLYGSAYGVALVKNGMVG